MSKPGGDADATWAEGAGIRPGGRSVDVSYTTVVVTVVVVVVTFTGPPPVVSPGGDTCALVLIGLIGGESGVGAPIGASGGFSLGAGVGAAPTGEVTARGCSLSLIVSVCVGVGFGVGVGVVLAIVGVVIVVAGVTAAANTFVVVFDRPSSLALAAPVLLATVFAALAVAVGASCTGGRALGFPRALPSDTSPVDDSAAAGAPRAWVGAAEPPGMAVCPAALGLPAVPLLTSELLFDLAITGGAGSAPTAAAAALLFDIRVLPSERVVVDGPLAVGGPRPAAAAPRRFAPPGRRPVPPRPPVPCPPAGPLGAARAAVAMAA